MALQTPTIAEINATIIAQLEATLSQTIPLLPKSFLRVLSKTLAAVFVTLYKYGGFTFLQVFVSSASDKETIINGLPVTPLVEWGRLIGIGDPVAATNAELLIDITVENQVGSLPSGSQLINSDNGVTYITLAAVALSAPTVQATIKAVSDQTGGGGAGAIGNLEPADIVSFANPLPNVARDAVVDSQTVTGADAESTAAYRQRIVDRFQKRPQGGAYADYEIWGEEVAGIINIYPYTSASPGQVDVYAEATEASSGSADGIPTAPQLQAVADSIELDDAGLASRRPANAFVNVFAITRSGFDTEITGLSVDNQAQVETDIEDALDEFYRAAEPFIDGLTIPPRKDRITRSAIIGLVDDIVSAANGTFTTVTFDITTVGGSLELYILQEGEKAKSVTVTFV
jgi:uncharacterized phage protein gp47/JayE